MCKLHPEEKVCDLNDTDLSNICINSSIVLNKAINLGGTTIRSYTSDEGITGLFQNNLYVHCREKEKCLTCNSIILKTRIGGRGTYYCPKCQKERND